MSSVEKVVLFFTLETAVKRYFTRRRDKKIYISEENKKGTKEN